MASDPVLLCTPPLPGLGPVSSSVNVLTRSQCWAPHSPRKHGELGLRDTHTDRTSGYVPVQLGEKGQVGDPDRGQSHTDDPHCCSQTPGTCGQPVPLVPRLRGPPVLRGGGAATEIWVLRERGETKNALVTVLTPTAEQSLLERGQKAG